MLSSVMYGAYVVGYVLVWRKVAGALVEGVRQREQRSPWVEEYVRCALVGCSTASSGHRSPSSGGCVA
jgi:hypothetical protein